MAHPAAGALPQPGPVFQALPEPAPLPPLPRPAPQLQAAMPDEASSMAAMTPMAAPAGEASAQYQVSTLTYLFVSGIFPDLLLPLAGCSSCLHVHHFILLPSPQRLLP